MIHRKAWFLILLILLASQLSFAQVSSTRKATQGIPPSGGPGVTTNRPPGFKSLPGKSTMNPVSVRNIYPVDETAYVNPTLEISCPLFRIEAAQYVIARDTGFGNIVYDSGEHASDIHCHLAFAHLDSLTQYFWKARVKNQKGMWSGWSQATTFTTIDTSSIYINVFRDGFFGYAGAADADIRGSFQDPNQAVREWNQGGQDVLRTGRRVPGSLTDEIYRALVQFDLSGLTNPDAVVGAYFKLTGWEHDGSKSEVHARNSLYELLHSWGEGDGLVGEFPDPGEASWTYSEYMSSWSLPGAADASDSNPLADRMATPLVKSYVNNEVGSTTIFSSLALLDLVKKWISDSGTNHGMLLKADRESIQEVSDFASREHTDLRFRPQLVIVSTEESPYTGANQTPSAAEDVAITWEEVPIFIPAVSNDSDPDVYPLETSIVSVDPPANGTARVIGTEILYSPDQGFYGEEQFDYTITDGAATDVATVTITVLQEGIQPPRITDGVVVYYPFDEGSGTDVFDQSGSGTPMNLTLTGSVGWNSEANGVVLSGGRVGTSSAATKVINALMTSGQCTFEIWIEADNLAQTGPARMFSIGEDTVAQNYVLGQIGDDVEARLFHTGKDAESKPRLVTSNNFLTTSLTHLVHTFDGTTERLYVNGVLHPTTVAATGNFSTWDTADFFSIGNEATGDRPWSGIARIAAVYDRPLSLSEVYQNYSAGPEGGL